MKMRKHDKYAPNTDYFQTLTSTLIALDGSEEYESTLEDARKVILSVEGEHGMRIIVDDLLAGIKNQNPQIRYISLVFLRSFCKVR